jgi:hypothetical protein
MGLSHMCKSINRLMARAIPKHTADAADAQSRESSNEKPHSTHHHQLPPLCKQK